MKRSTSNVIENALFQDHPYTKSNIEDPSIGEFFLNLKLNI